jgi:hypothetical protein
MHLFAYETLKIKIAFQKQLCLCSRIIASTVFTISIGFPLLVFENVCLNLYSRTVRDNGKICHTIRLLCRKVLVGCIERIDLSVFWFYHLNISIEEICFCLLVFRIKVTAFLESLLKRKQTIYKFLHHKKKRMLYSVIFFVIHNQNQELVKYHCNIDMFITFFFLYFTCEFC